MRKPPARRLAAEAGLKYTGRDVDAVSQRGGCTQLQLILHSTLSRAVHPHWRGSTETCASTRSATFSLSVVNRNRRGKNLPCFVWATSRIDARTQNQAFWGNKSKQAKTAPLFGSLAELTRWHKTKYSGEIRANKNCCVAQFTNGIDARTPNQAV